MTTSMMTSKANMATKLRSKADRFHQKALNAEKRGNIDLADQWRKASDSLENLLTAREAAREATKWAASQTRLAKAKRARKDALGGPSAEVSKVQKAKGHRRSLLHAASGAEDKIISCKGRSAPKALTLPPLEIEGDVAKQSIADAKGKRALWKIARSNGVAKGERCHGFIRAAKVKDVTFENAKTMLLTRLTKDTTHGVVRSIAGEKGQMVAAVNHMRAGRKEEINAIKAARGKRALWKIARAKGVRKGDTCHGYIKEARAEDVTIHEAKRMLIHRLRPNRALKVGGRAGAVNKKQISKKVAASSVGVMRGTNNVDSAMANADVIAMIQAARGKRMLWAIAHDKFGQRKGKCRKFITEARKKHVTLPDAKNMLVDRLA